MKGKYFKHIEVPGTWKQYWSRYPQGYTIIESLIDWASQNNLLTENVNEWNKYLDQFVETFDKNLQGTVTDLLRKWQEDGTLEVIISEALQTQINEVDDRLTKQMGDITLNVREYGIVGNGVADDTEPFQRVLNAGGNMLFPKGLTIRITRRVNIKEYSKIDFNGCVIKMDLLDPVTGTDGVFNLQSEIELKNFTIDGLLNDIRGVNAFEKKNITIVNAEIVNLKKVGAYFTNCENVYLRYLHVHDTMVGGNDGMAGAIRFTGCVNVDCRNIKIERPHGKGIALATTTNGTLQDITVVNTLESGDGLYYGEGSTMINAQNIVVINPTGNGVKISRGANRSSVKNSSFKKTSGVGHGILMQGAINCIVENNLFEYSGVENNPVRIEDHPDPSGSDCYGNIFIKNTVKNGVPTSDTISARTRGDSGSPYKCFNNTIEENLIIGGNAFIRFVNVNYIKIIRNDVENINGYCIASNGRNIFAIITDNRFEWIKNTPISCVGLDKAIIKNNLMATLTGVYLGIQLATGSRRSLITGNVVTGFERGIIIADQESDGNIISENIVVGTGIETSFGIDYRGISGKVINNTIQNVTTLVAINQPSENVVESGNTI